MAVRLSSNGRLLRTLRGPWADERTDHTARLHARRAGARAAVRRRRSRSPPPTAPPGSPERVSFSTAPIHPAATLVRVVRATPAARGWGINEELGGLTTYRAMHRDPPGLLHPLRRHDLRRHRDPVDVQDEDTGEVWRNVVTEERREGRRDASTSSAAGTATRCSTGNVRALYAEVPTIAQWDDHETLNNWYPGERRRRRPLRRAPLRRARRPRPPRLAGVPAGARSARLRRPRRRRLRVRRGSTAGSRAAQHLDVFVPRHALLPRRPTTPSDRSSQPGHPRAGPGGAG